MVSCGDATNNEIGFGKPELSLPGVTGTIDADSNIAGIVNDLTTTEAKPLW